ncbi:MAG TPA: hypothetical protein VKS60_18115 [Stellaceae bacterium]|nr:hypothetical protein [Stellaceae bacterium]
MARVLSIAGAALPKDLIPANPTNEAGHWEPIDVANFNDRLLAKLDSRWDSIFAPRRNRKGALPLSRYKAEAQQIIREQYGDETLIVLKEPRITLLIDFWEEVLRAEGFQCAFVIMVRKPEEVAASLKVRDQMERTRALLLWATYMSQADLLTRRARRMFCSYDRLLSEPEAVLDSIEETLEVDLPRRTVKSSAEIDRFLRPTLRHHASSDHVSINGELKPVGRLADYSFGLSLGDSPNEDVAALTQEWLRSLDALISPMLLAFEEQAQSAMAEANDLRGQVASTEALLQQSRESTDSADAARIAESGRRAEVEEALARAQRQLDVSVAHLQNVEQESAANFAEEAARRAAAEGAVAHLQQAEQEAAAKLALAAQKLAETEDALAHAQQQAEAAAAQLQIVEQEGAARSAEEANRRDASEAALAQAESRYEEDMAHVRRLEQEANAALAATEGRLVELNERLVAAAELETAQNAEVDGLRTELASQLSALAQARAHDAEALRELNGLRGEAALSAAERSQAQDEVARLQAELAAERQLAADRGNELAGYQRSILYRSRDLLLRARASVLNRRRS